ncbi:hypothetical protein GOV07_02510 [Candidatus Woesearchaeota archaeon]|nr:hypothetical protein [Candidatus Woesearchaeota archaeon]
MKQIAILCILLIALPLALADPLDDADYITVVTDDGGAKEVIAAANYASNMRIYGYTFTGAMDSAVESIKNVDEKFLIYFDGKKALIVDGIDNNHAVVRSQQYLENKGYTVNLSVPGEIFPSAFFEDNEPIPEEIIAVPDNMCDGCRYGVQCLPKGTRADSQYCAFDGEMVRQRATGESCVYKYECWSNDCRGTCYDEAAPHIPESKDYVIDRGPNDPLQQKQGLFKRFFGWLKGLFS